MKSGDKVVIRQNLYNCELVGKVVYVKRVCPNGSAMLTTDASLSMRDHAYNDDSDWCLYFFGHNFEPYEETKDEA